MSSRENFDNGLAKVIRAEASAQGLLATLEDLSDQLNTNPRYYALLSCLGKIAGDLEEAIDEFDRCDLGKGD